MKNLSNSLPKRRRFLKQALTGSASAMAWPTLALDDSGPTYKSFKKAVYNKSAIDEKFWELVKKQFAVKDGLMMVNGANLCPSPHFVNVRVNESFQKLEEDVSFQYRSVFSGEREAALEDLSTYLGVPKSEIGITRNTSESNNTIVHGLDLKEGDEVILWEENHPTNGIAWEEQSKRIGFTVKRVSLPKNPTSKADLVAPFEEAITSNTRLISFSHISNVSGLALPAKGICAMAREKGVLSMVDGAQSFGVMNVDLKELGCDFYTGSTHKWLMGPLENGIIYMNGSVIDSVWPSVIGAGWKAGSDTVDAKYCVMGQRNETTCSAITNIIDFHQTIGKQEIEDRTLQLNSYLKERIGEELPQIKLVTPISQEFSGGVTILDIPKEKGAELFKNLYASHGIACAPTGGLRFSPHIYNTLADMDRIVRALKEEYKKNTN